MKQSPATDSLTAVNKKQIEPRPERSSFIWLVTDLSGAAVFTHIVADISGACKVTAALAIDQALRGAL